MAKNNNNSTTSKVQECFQELMEEAKEKTNLSEIFEKAEAIADKHNLQLSEKPASWIMDTLDFVDKGRVLEEWLLQASKKSAEDEPAAPAEKEALGPTAEVTIAEPDSAHRELPSQQQPYPEKFNNPPKGTFTFAAASREDIKKLNDLVGDLTDPNNEPDQTRGRVRDICDLALKLGADALVDVCEDFTEGDATRADVAATASEVLTYLATETRRAELNEAFEQFCVNQRITPEEMLAILS